MYRFIESSLIVVIVFGANIVRMRNVWLEECVQ